MASTITNDSGIIRLYDGTVVYIVEIQYSTDGLTNWENTFYNTTHTHPNDATSTIGAHRYMRVRHAGDTTFQSPMYINGEDGDEVELQVSGDYIQWKLSESTTWINLLATSTLQGDRGPVGAGLEIDAIDELANRANYETAAALVNSSESRAYAFMRSDGVSAGDVYFYYDSAWTGPYSNLNAYTVKADAADASPDYLDAKIDTNYFEITAGDLISLVDDSIDIDKLGTLTRGSLVYGDASGEMAALDAKTDGYLLIGDGTDIASVAMSGDATITNAGVVSLANDCVVGANIDVTALESDGALLIAGSPGTTNSGTGLEINVDGTTIEISSNAIQVVDTSITAAKLANNAVTNAKMADNSVTASEIQDSAVTTAKINDDAITAAKINDAAVGIDAISTAIAGSGLTGGGGSALAVGEGTPATSGITVSADAIAINDGTDTWANVIKDSVNNTYGSVDDGRMIKISDTYGLQIKSTNGSWYYLNLSGTTLGFTITP